MSGTQTTSARSEVLVGALADVMALAVKHSVKRSTTIGPAVESVTLNEVASIVAQAHQAALAALANSTGAAKHDAEVLRAAADEGPYATEGDRFWRAWLRERADRIAGDQS